MKILFSPSEAKSLYIDSPSITNNSFCFPAQFEHRLEVINKFNCCIESSNISNLQKLFGLKDENECLKIRMNDILKSSTCKAIKRYNGVAFKYLEFDTLNDSDKEWIYENVIIFSNLFGPLLAKDEIPLYKFKQGSSIDGFKPEVFYKEKFTNELNNYICSDFVIDLRAGFYEKFYKFSMPYITMKFIKNGKVVSHWAKAYRGKILRELAQYKPNNIDEFESINFQGLELKEIIQTKLKREYIFNILT